MITFIVVICIILVVIVLLFIALYNNLIKLRNRVDNAWAQVEVQLQRRFDLILNVVETVKGYTQHEAGTLEAVTAARGAFMGAQSPEEKMDASNMLQGTLKSLFAVAEAYPNLKANENYLELQAELSSTEDKISYMRQSFNDVVMAYNTGIQTFPAVLFAGMMGFSARKGFDSQEGAGSAPQVRFSA